MKVLENSRQVPKDKQNYLSNINYCDYLYAYLQVISKWSGKPDRPRFILKKDCSFVKIADALGVNRQTISKKFKAMLEGEPGSVALIRKEKNGYSLLPIEKNLAMLVPYGTLQILTSAVSQNAISIYVYLLNRYIASNERKFRYTIEELKSVIGISTKTRSNNYIITSILFLLAKLGLIKYQKEIFGDQTFEMITWMTNEINQLPDDLDEEFSDRYRKLIKICT